MNLSFLRRLFAATFITGSILLPTANALADVIQSPEATISNINPTCCSCTNSQNNIRGFFEIPYGTNCTNFKDETSVRGTRPASDFANITCTSVASCPNPKQASQLYSTLNPPASTPSTPNMESAPRPLIVPTLGVPIPGITFSGATIEDSDIVVPFLAQYISGIYRYGVGIVGLVATIMVVYGGFQYLIGSSTGDIKTGKTLITNAVVGMILVFASYAILYTVNPALLQPGSLRLPFIVNRPIPGNENVAAVDEGNNLDGCFGTTQGAAATGDSQNTPGYFVIPVHPYAQVRGAWANLAYGPGLLTNQNVTPCATNDDQRRQPACIGTIGQGGCGPTTLAVILSSYGLLVTDPGSAVLGTAAREQSHPFDPLDAAKFAVRINARPINNGTAASIFTRASQLGPYRTRSIGTAAEASQAIRNGHLIAFLCENCTVTKNNPNGITKSWEGHYMVIHGVNANATSFQVFDVGGGSKAFITAAEIEGRSPRKVSMWEIYPTGAASGGSCASTRTSPTGAAAGQTSVSGNITRSTFTYRPAGGSPSIWPDNQAQLLYPTALTSISNPRVHAFIYIHGNNDASTPSASAAYTQLLQDALRTVAGSKNIVIMAPHKNLSSFAGFNLHTFYAEAQAALARVLPGATIADVVVGGHSGATCNSPVPMISAASNPLPGQRGVIAYDGCLGDVLRRSNFNPSGQAIYLNPDIGGGMGGSVQGGRPRNEIVRTEWGLRQVSCPPCVATAGATAACYSKDTGGSGEIFSFETRYGHGPSVGKMSQIAFCAFYNNDR